MNPSRKSVLESARRSEPEATLAHLSRHIDSDDSSLSAYADGGDEGVQAGARTEVDAPLASVRKAPGERVRDLRERLAASSGSEPSGSSG